MADQERPSNQQSGINPEQLPPLEPTAEVPPVHSDKLNDPQYWNDKYAGKTAKVPVEHQDVKKPRKSPTILRRAVAGVAAVAVFGGGGVVGAKMLSGNDGSHEPQDRPTASAPVTPGEATPSTTETSTPEVAVHPTPLAAERYKDGDQLIRAWNAELNTWRSSGATQETVDNAKWLDVDSYVHEVADPLDEDFISVHFVSDWQQRPQLAEKIEGIKNDHFTLLRAYLMTANPAVADKNEEPFTTENHVTGTQVLESSEYTRVISFDYTVETNSDKNEAGERWIEDQDGWVGKNTVTFTLQTGVWKISDIKWATEE